jgi:hypothetical protein
MKPIILSVVVFIALASLTMHASNGFLHLFTGDGPGNPLAGLDAATAQVAGVIGLTPMLVILGALTGVSTGLVYWLAARPQRSVTEAKPNAKPIVQPKRAALKPRKVEQPLVDTTRMQKVMGLSTRAANPKDGQFTA